MDKASLAEWRAFLSAPSVRRARDCYFLFMDALSVADIEQIFDGVPKGPEMAPRLARIKGVGDAPPPIEGPDRQARLEAIAQEMLAEKRRIFIANGQQKLADIFAQLSVRWTDTEGYSAARADAAGWVQGEAMSLLGDALRGALGDASMLATALSEATYGATSSYDMVWYLLTPLLQIEYASEPAMLLRENGVTYALTETELVLVDHRA